MAHVFLASPFSKIRSETVSNLLLDFWLGGFYELEEYCQAEVEYAELRHSYFCRLIIQM